MYYMVDSCVCDYGVYEIYDDERGKRHKKLMLICNSLSNAKLIAEIMNEDLQNAKYEFKAEKEKNNGSNSYFR